MGRPTDIWDADGRFGKGVGKAGMDLLFGTAGLVNNTLGTLGYTLTSPFAPDWAYENFGSYAEGFTDTVGGLAQTAYDAGAFGSYALISPFNNDLAYQAYGGSMERLRTIGNGLTGGDGSLAYRIGYGGFNAATLLLGAELSQVGRAGEINFANSAATTLWQNRFPGVQVRQIGDYWAKRVNPQSSDLMQAWGARTIQAQAEALETLRAAGRPAADSRLFESGRLVVENVGTPLGYGQYLNPYYWGARIQDSRALGTFINDLRPGNYGAGFRAFDPALDPIQAGIGIGGGILVGGGVAYGVFTLGGGQ